MRPSARQIIEGIIAAIDTTILPAVEEKQAASSLRAARTLLEHLATRVGSEVEVLAADNADAAETIAALLGRPDGEDREHGLDLASLEARNFAMQEIIDRALRALPAAGRETREQAAIHAGLRAYLARRHARERPMVFPAFLGTPF